MKKRKQTIRFDKLISKFEKSGFSVYQKTEKQLLAKSAKPSSKKRQTKAAIFGLIVEDEYEIHINKNLTEKEKQLSLLHELVHLYDPTLSETDTESQAKVIFRSLSEAEMGYLDYLMA